MVAISVIKNTMKIEETQTTDSWGYHVWWSVKHKSLMQLGVCVIENLLKLQKLFLLAVLAIEPYTPNPPPHLP